MNWTPSMHALITTCQLKRYNRPRTPSPLVTTSCIRADVCTSFKNINSYQAAEVVCRSTGGCLHRHQSLTAPVCCPHIFQKDHHCTCPQKDQSLLLPSNTHLYYHEVLWAVSQNLHHLLPPWLTSICIQAKQVNRPSPPHGPLPPGSEEHRECYSLTIGQHSIPLCPTSLSSSSKTLDSALPRVTDGQTPSCTGRHYHILHPDSPHQRP